MSDNHVIPADIISLISLKTIDYPEEHILNYDKEPELPSFRKDSDISLTFEPDKENKTIRINIPEIQSINPQITITPEEQSPNRRSKNKPAKIEIVQNYNIDEENEKNPWTLNAKSSLYFNNEPTPTFMPNVDENDLWDNFIKTEKDEKKIAESLAFGDVSNIEKDSQLGGIGTYSEIPTLLGNQNSGDIEDFNSSYQAEENIKPETKELDYSLILGNVIDVSILPAHNETIIMQTESNPISSPSILQVPNKPQKTIKVRQRSMKIVSNPKKSSFSPANRKNAHSISIKPLKKPKNSSKKSNVFLSSQEFNFTNSLSSKQLNPVKLRNKRESFTKVHLNPNNPYIQELRKFNQKLTFNKKTVVEASDVGKKSIKKKRIIFF